MGEMDVMPQIALARMLGTEFPVAVREAFNVLFGVLGAGPTGAQSRSQSSRSEVTEGLGLRRWEFFR